MARTELPNGVILPAEYSDDWYEDMTSNLTKLDDVIGSDSEKLNSNDVAFLRMSSAALTDGGTGNFSDLNSSNKLKTGDYVLDSGRKLYQVVSVDSTNETFTVGNSLFKITAESDLAPVAESGDYDDLDNKPDLNPYDQHIVNTDIHVTTADKTKWNNGVTQSYVFRYSGTAITNNSTIAYSTIDNTDNIKSGDKILDVDGKLFEITAVDTANQTVTVGSALVDLALDSNVVHTSGNETISGDKVFNNRLIKNIDVVLGTVPSTGKFSIIDIADNNKVSLLQVLGGVYDTGNSYARFFVQNKTADDGTGLSPTGTIRACGFNINLPASSTSDGQGSITPRANKTTDFGLVGYQWRNMWCEKLFLNGTQLDPSAFVTLSDAQTITGNKVWTGTSTFQQNVTYQRTNLYHQASSPCYILKDTDLEKGSLVASSQASYPGLWQDKNSAILGYMRFVEFSSGRQTAEFRVSNLIKDGALNPTGSEVNCTVLLELQPSGKKSLIPEQNNDINLGTVSNKWKSFNGLTPSSLGMPNLAGKVDITGYVTDLTGAPNIYTSPDNGYIILRSTNADILGIIENITGMGTISRGANQIIAVYLPVVASSSISLYAKCTSLSQAYFIPCQGNV